MRWRLGVVGFPIEHSLSPVLHEAGLHLAGLEGTSTRVALRQDETTRLAELMRSSFDALSVTMPLKESALALCDEVGSVASRVGVVNSLLARDGRLLGDSTDGPGFVDALLWLFGVEPSGMDVLVLGAGGAARSIVDALIEAGAASVEVGGRTRAHVERLASRYDRVSSARVGGHADLIVNTVPATTRGEFSSDPKASSTTICVDIAYEPRTTPWLVGYSEMGCRCANGLAMLAFQAARQMRWWWDVEIDGANLLESLS